MKKVIDGKLYNSETAEKSRTIGTGFQPETSKTFPKVSIRQKTDHTFLPVKAGQCRGIPARLEI